MMRMNNAITINPKTPNTTPIITLLSTKDANEITKSVTGKILNKTEKACNNVAAAHKKGLYGLLGFTLKALSTTRFPPSITHLIRKGPSQVVYKNVPSGLQDVFQDKEIPQTCENEDALNYLSFTLQKYGFADSRECISNEAIPDDPDRCVTEKKTKTKLKGYRIGHFVDYEARDVRGLIQRFGAVLIDEQIFVGWENTKWIVAVNEDKKEYKYTGVMYGIDEFKKYSGYLVFNASYVDNNVIIGVVFGVLGIIAIALFILIIYCCCCRKKKEQEYQNAEMHGTGSESKV
ncbi:MAG: hypothetical protein EZS28_031063 [Streblomastix strix]|uniref:Uncharacterized protein n=1 Tax=Streblomastix strix TaxID=222440 RepID=A0A5J4UTD0_9EUKA|nr:MAG: hypothetical protein EZS28_031063 [Streblomastix strix]